jgi:hypothetical protein
MYHAYVIDGHNFKDFSNLLCCGGWCGVGSLIRVLDSDLLVARRR